MSHNPLTILIADDDSEDLELIEHSMMMVDPKTSIRLFNNGRSVIEYLAAQPGDELPCLIILDYNMPELTGSEVLQLIGHDKRYKNIPKVILSTSNASLHITECKNNGATEYFVKPNNIHDLDILSRKMLALCQKNPS